MPWCPRCDETFPEGPACPRCNARLIQREGEPADAIEALRSVPAVRGMRVSRRYRRALDRLSGPRPHSLRLLVFSIVALVFVSGFLLGRFEGISPSEPTVRALAPARPLDMGEIDGSAAYALWSREPLATIALHDLYSGEVSPLARFSPPISSGPVRTELASFGRSVALIAADSDHSYVAFAASGAPPHGWVPGVEAAWSSENELYVRQRDGSVTKWNVGPDDARSVAASRADRIIQTSSGAVAQSGGRLSRIAGGAAVLPAPPSARVIAVSPDLDRALVDDHGPALWDGHKLQPVRAEGFAVVGASFERSGDRVAATLRRDGELTLAVVDARGNAALKPLGVAERGCSAAAAWDSAGRWLYVAPGDGVLYVVESGGGRVERVHTRSVGCGLAWLAI